MEDSPYFTQQNPYSCDSKGKVREQQSVGDNQPSTSYDYLNGARFGNRSTEIRYLNEVSKYVTDTLRQICEQPVTPPLCSQLQKRYLNHRKSCSRGNVNLDKWSLVSMDRKVQCGIEPCAMTSTSCGSENI
ncbi:uncharacterized protein LOC113235563, partial [Hyposmocoma kahamanoa]|uniref:uncharacterized protein LOC113235563 n=1 Tax=Hyposmocoma kahamanoa TaxID=1477025 RepID=UPI000E6D95C3